MCVLYDHLVRQKEQARIKQELYEIERFDREISQHVERCVVCREKSMTRLRELFKNQVVVTEA